MPKETPYLDVQNLTKSFGSLLLFENINFSIAEGQKVGLIAKNGTGKSTLLSLLSGKEGYDEGSIIFRRDLKVGMLEQSPVFDPEERVLDACFRSAYGRSFDLDHSEDAEKVLKAKQILTQLKIRDLQQPMGQLSGGQQKRVALANVLITEPDLLILDGGKPQLTAAINQLAELGLDIPMAGLAKKDEELYVPWDDEGPVVLPSGSPSACLKPAEALVAARDAFVQSRFERGELLYGQLHQRGTSLAHRKPLLLLRATPLCSIRSHSSSI
jgi:ABC-type branched-subunit amino acid transport system ATPase component